MPAGAFFRWACHVGDVLRMCLACPRHSRLYAFASHSRETDRLMTGRLTVVFMLPASPHCVSRLGRAKHVHFYSCGPQIRASAVVQVSRLMWDALPVVYWPSLSGPFLWRAKGALLLSPLSRSPAICQSSALVQGYAPFLAGNAFRNAQYRLASIRNQPFAKPS